MGVYINMEMPTSCRKCMISQPDGCGWICPIIESKPIVDGRVNSRHPLCPIVPVPPHGDLIERDKLLNGDGVYLVSFQKSAIDTMKIIKAPTIIPAEEGEA